MKNLMTMKQEQLHQMLYKYLKKNYETVIIRNKFIIAIGDISIGLVAHLDTVHKQLPKQFFYDQEQGVLWSPQGLGADDRAGVYAIIQIIESGYRPHIILCQDEEIGGRGAEEVIKSFPYIPFKNLKCLIELDRKGKNDCVFYDCANNEFIDYIEKFGFKEATGSFSDISILAPEWEVAAVNLSIGYDNEHTLSEILYSDYLLATIKKVKEILKKEKEMPNYSYISRIYYNNRDTKCIFCQRELKVGEGFSLYNWNFCADYCKNCYQKYFN